MCRPIGAGRGKWRRLGCLLAFALGCDPSPAVSSSPPAQGQATEPVDAESELSSAEPSAESPVAEGEACAEPAEPLEPAERWSDRERTSGKALSEAACDALERKIVARLDELTGPCETAADCELLEAPCPFGCERVIGKAGDRAEVRKDFDRYAAGCPRCKYKCAAQATELACVEGRCEIAARVSFASCSD